MAQPTEFSSDEPRLIDETGSWLEENRAGVLAALALVVLLLGAGIWWWQGRQARAAEAAALLLQAKESVAWQKIADTYSGTTSAPLALIHLAEAARQKGEWDQALGHLDRFLKEYPRHPFYPATQLSHAQTLEAAGKTDAAVQAYEVLHNARPAHPFVGPAVLGLARIYRAQGKLTAAREVLSDFLATERSSSYAGEASWELKSLPEEVPAPAPAAAAP